MPAFEELEKTYGEREWVDDDYPSTDFEDLSPRSHTMRGSGSGSWRSFAASTGCATCAR
jgi:hypothetical protein